MPTRSAGRREQQALDDLAADKLHAAAAERGADGGLAAARGGTRHQQVRDVEAGDQQQAAGGGKQCIEPSLHIAHLPIKDGAKVHGIIHRAIRMLLPNLSLDGAELGGCLFPADARTQLANDVEVVASRSSACISGRALVIERHPELRARIRIAKPRRQNAEDRIGLGIDQNGAAR